jgi:dTMP kinase
MTEGKFVVIEGTDGSGKGTQCNLLIERLKQSGQDPMFVDFPRYGNPSAFFVEKYLNGGYGELRDSNPWRASLFYALDRFDASVDMWATFRAGRLLIANRYVASNMGHQASKINSPEARKDYFKWLYDLEYGTFGIPRPTLNIVLHVPADVAYQLVAQKGERNYLAGAKRDIHEADIDHLRRAEQTYMEMVSLFPDEFVVIECAPEGEILPVPVIHEKVWQKVSELL